MKFDVTENMSIEELLKRYGAPSDGPLPELEPVAPDAKTDETASPKSKNNGTLFKKCCVKILRLEHGSCIV